MLLTIKQPSLATQKNLPTHKAWDKMQVFLDAYNKYLYDGITTIYNSDSIVTLDLED